MIKDLNHSPIWIAEFRNGAKYMEQKGNEQIRLQNWQPKIFINIKNFYIIYILYFFERLELIHLNKKG